MITELDILEDQLHDAISMREAALIHGTVSSWEEYKYLTGVVAGLSGALEAVRERQQMYQED